MQKFNDHQRRLWNDMLSAIVHYREGKIHFFDVVGRLLGAMDAGEFKDAELVRAWSDRWLPLDEITAVARDEGRNVLASEVDGPLKEMEAFLRKTLTRAE